MLLLHISDIHFRKPDCPHPDTDPDHAYRTLLMHEVRRQAESLGAIGAILVGGDIAFKGDPKEYEIALAWLKELAKVCGCPFERIFVVLGNHDVDRRTITNTPSVRNVQRAIAQAEPQHRERELRTQFNDAETGRSLLLPLTAYNEFAKLFSCQVYSPDHLYWKQDVTERRRTSAPLWAHVGAAVRKRRQGRCPRQPLSQPASDCSRTSR